MHIHLLKVISIHFPKKKKLYQTHHLPKTENLVYTQHILIISKPTWFLELILLYIIKECVSCLPFIVKP